MTAPATADSARAQTIRDARGSVAGDIAKSRARLAKITADLRAETKTLAELTAIAEVVGVTEVETPSTAALVDAGVEPMGLKLATG